MSRANTPRARQNCSVAQRLAEASVIAPDSTWQPLSGGADSDVTAARAVDGSPLVVKTRRAGRRARYGIAAWAASRIAQAGVPVPTVVWHDAQTCVETRIPGRTLADSGDKAAALDAGRLLRRVHLVRVDGFGRLNAAGKGQHRHWHTWLLAMPAAAAVADHAGGYAGALVRRAHAVLSQSIHHLPIRSARLLHGDWTARHVLARAGRVTGFVDLESVRGGDPLADLAGWALQEPTFLTAALFTGYFPRHGPSPAQCTALTLYRIRIAASLLAYDAACGETGAVALRTEQLRADLADFTAGHPQPAPRIAPVPP